MSTMLIFNLSMTCVGFANHFGLVFFLYMIYSLGLAIFGPSAVCLVVDYFPAKYRTFVMGAVTIG